MGFKRPQPRAVPRCSAQKSFRASGFEDQTGDIEVRLRFAANASGKKLVPSYRHT
jgi:hypothetical protein